MADIEKQAKEVEFQAKVLSVEQRTQPVFHEGFGTAKSESKAREHVEEVEIPVYFITFENWPMSLLISQDAQAALNLEAGDTLALEARVIKCKK